MGDFPERAGRAAAPSGFAMMFAAFVYGRIMSPSLGSNAWLVISNALGSVVIAFAAWVMVPRAYAESAARIWLIFRQETHTALC